MAEVRARRVYSEPQPDDGKRILVDRLWPRGLAKDAAHIDEWLKAVAPSDELRRWYGHDPAKWAEFRHRYATELIDPERAAAVRHLRELSCEGPVTLLTATKDLDHSQAADLARRLTELAAGDDRPGDSACWLNRVCPRCGSMADEDPPTTCPHCHTPVPGD
ncbi:MAG TPA: DUF488 family protein [Streptosporangiaceae bacterium]|jgi:uncharacterized protein YeaO (DUF488 family)|nr:DUF488 family protein [Streptosporangiaceae bacterium]